MIKNFLRNHRWLRAIIILAACTSVYSVTETPWNILVALILGLTVDAILFAVTGRSVLTPSMRADSQGRVYFPDKAVMEQGAGKVWAKVIQTSDFPSELLDPVRSVLVPRNVDPMLFIENLAFLERGGMNSLDPFAPKVLKVSQSVYEFQRVYDRPTSYSLWFLAAFPDVASWLSSLIERAQTQDDAKALDVLNDFWGSLGVDDPSELSGADGGCSTSYANAMVELFIAQTGRQPECCL